MKKILPLILLTNGALFSVNALAAATVSTFDDLPLAPNSVFFPEISTTFTSGVASYQHTFTDYGDGCCTSDWTYSSMTDTVTPGSKNQYSAITGGGVDGSANYVVAYPDFYHDLRISFASATSLLGAYFTNTTYAYLAMKDGNDGGGGFVERPFGEDDFFKLTIHGLDSSDAKISSVDFLLADGINIVDEWTWVDLSTLGAVSALSFEFTSSYVNQWGPVIPTYFAMDNLTAVPLPPALVLMVPAIAGLGLWTRKAA